MDLDDPTYLLPVLIKCYWCGVEDERAGRKSRRTGEQLLARFTVSGTFYRRGHLKRLTSMYSTGRFAQEMCELPQPGVP